MSALPRIRPTMLGTAALVALLSALLVGLRRPTPRTTNLGFTVHLDGRGAEGIDDIWRGVLDAPNAGVIAIRLEHKSPSPAALPETAGMVHAIVFVSYDNVARSFGADVSGRISETGTAHLSGAIDVGAARGATIDVTMHLNAKGCHGTIAFSPVGPRTVSLAQ